MILKVNVESFKTPTKKKQQTRLFVVFALSHLETSEIINQNNENVKEEEEAKYFL